MHANRHARHLAAGPLLAVAAVLACAPLDPLHDCQGEGEIEVLCGFQNPEDLAAAPGGEWIVVSQSPRLVDDEITGGGSLLVLRPRDGERRVLFPLSGTEPHAGAAGVGSPECGGPPEAERFSPHGIDVSAGVGGVARLLVVNHGGREAIELFRLEVSDAGPSATWEGCVPLPEDAQANDVAALPERGFVVTNMLPRGAGLLGQLRLVLGLAPVREDPRVDPRVQRLHPPIEHLGRTRDLLDRRHLETGLAERRRGAAARDEGHAELGEPFGQLDDAGLVVHGEEGTPNAHRGPPGRMRTRRPSTRTRPSASARTAAGSSRCSTS